MKKMKEFKDVWALGVIFMVILMIVGGYISGIQKEGPSKLRAITFFFSVREVSAAESLAPFVPTPTEVVEKMLELAGITKNDLVYDLGCGDGRIVITAAKKYGARGVGVDIDPERIKESKENAMKAGVENLVEFRLQDAMTVDLSPATVVTLYLLSESNMKLRPLLWKYLKTGARVVSHQFDMGDWEPSKVINIDDSDRALGATLYLWVIGEKRKGS